MLSFSMKNNNNKDSNGHHHPIFEILLTLINILKIKFLVSNSFFIRMNIEHQFKNNFLFKYPHCFKFLVQSQENYFLLIKY